MLEDHRRLDPGSGGGSSRCRRRRREIEELAGDGSQVLEIELEVLAIAGGSSWRRRGGSSWRRRVSLGESFLGSVGTGFTPHVIIVSSGEGVRFSMPLCTTEVEEATEDDMIEFSKIQTLNLGQTLYIDALSEVDNTTQSLLSFTGNKSVHGLYDVLVNYKSFLNSLSATDVPVLYSPVAFQNGCLHIPEVICREVRKADTGPASSIVLDVEEQPGSALAAPPGGNMCYSMEIKDVVVPPWVVSGVCAAMSTDAERFDVTIATEPSSMGLNAALSTVGGNSSQSPKKKPSADGGCEALGVPGAVLVPSLHTASLRRLSYSNGEYITHTTV